MFMQYLRSVSANPFAKWLLANNDVLLALKEKELHGMCSAGY